MNRIIAACGNDCARCPRRMARTSSELEAVAQFWQRAGWRDRIVKPEEIRCSGCSVLNSCRYQIFACAVQHQVGNCGKCPSYPCGSVVQMFETTRQYEQDCRRLCSPSGFGLLKKAFFEKQKNLEENPGDLDSEEGNQSGIK